MTNDQITTLEMRDISKSFGATHALRGVSFTAVAGRVLALVGENGAGKSTLMKVLSGAHLPDRGTMTLGGAPYSPRGPHDARLDGVAMIYQELTLAPHLSVADNIMLGCETHRWGWLDRRAQRMRVRQALGQLGLADLSPDVPVYQLSVAQQQLVEIARALVIEARVIVFDEPTSSLTQQDVQRLFDIIGKLRQSGLAIIYISHFLEEVREVCDCFTVLRDGEIAGSGDLSQTSDAELVTMMVGRTVDELFPAVEHSPGEALLRLDRLNGWVAPVEVDLTLRRGEVLGVAGLVGAGRTELLRAIFGLDAVRSGQVRVGQHVLRGSPRASIRAGVGFVSEDRKTEGLAQSRSIADNVTLSRLGPYSRGGWLSLAKRREAVQHWMRVLQVKAQSDEQTIDCLSGGNQQKIAIARVLHQDADVLLLDEPTRGIDVGTKAEIYRLIGEQTALGKAIIFVSSYLPELLAVCDRVAVMSRGRVQEIRSAEQWSAESAMAVAVSGVNSDGNQ